MKRALVLLTFNESEALPRIFDRIPRDCADECLAIDGGSQDGTQAFLASRGVPVHVQPRRGRGVAFRMAPQLTTAEALVYFSPDGNEDPADIAKLFERLEQGAELAIASRMMRGAVNEEDVHWYRPRKWANKAFTLIANLLWNRSGTYVTDTINGFRAIRRDALARLACDADGFVIEYQMSIRAMKARLRIAEIPTHESPRLGGQSTARSLDLGLIFLRQLGREIVGGRPRPG